MVKEAHLILQDGRIFSGTSFGYENSGDGEVVFNTSLMGYQEILTDPSYKGQIVVMTYPQIGNYGVNALDVESQKIYLSGFVVKECSPIVSNFRANGDLSSYLKKNKIPAIEGIDTRALVRHIREKGAMPARIHIGPLKNSKNLLKAVSQLPSMDGQNLASQVSCTQSYQWTKGSEEFLGIELTKPKKTKVKYKVVAYDYGMKENILRLLVDHGCKVTVVPADTPSSEVLKDNPDGIFLSNGPGDPAACETAISNVRELIGKKPIFGICLGHQILSLALGATSFKLKFGHHGGNQPVMDLKTRKVEITSQNHGFAIDKVPSGVKVSHVNLNDNTVEGIEHETLPAFSVQYHPEASPGPHDSHYLFDRFVAMMEAHK